MPTSRASCLGLAALMGLALCLLAAPAALAKFNVKRLRVGSTSGAEDYLYTAGNTVIEQASLDAGRYYRFDVYDPSGTARLTTACRPSPGNNVATGSYTLRSADPLSSGTAWRFRLREFGSTSACTAGTSAQHDGSLYFDVAAAASYHDAALTTAQSVFGAATSAYVKVNGVGEVKTSGSNSALGVGTWSTTWVLPSGATACANTRNSANDLPGSTAAGQLPDRTSLPTPAQPNLQYRPSSTPGVDAWNVEANYETRPCQDFAGGNQGQWKLKLMGNSTHFVTLPVFAVNSTPPETTLTSAPTNVTASATARFDFVSSEAGSTFQCSLDGAAPSACTSPQTYSSLSDGPHTFSVQAIDQAGNVDPTPATTSWTVDTTAPSVTLSSPAAGSYTNDTTPALAGTAETAAGDSDVTVAVYPGTASTGSPAQSLDAKVQANGSWSVDASPLPDGTYTALARQTDVINNTGYSQQHTFTIDTAPPRVTLYSPANGTHTNDTTPDINGAAGTAASDAATVAVTVSGPGAPVNASASVSSAGTWGLSLTQALADGNYTIQATQQDLAGNTGYSTSHITVDTTPPQTVLDAAPVGTTSSGTATFSFHATDSLSQSGSTFQCQLDGGAWGQCSSPQTYHNLADGSHTFSVEAIDGAGNVDTTGQSATWTINSSLPAISLENPPDNSYTNDSTPTFSGTAGIAPGDSSSVQVLVFKSTDLSGSPVQTLNTSAGGDGSWAATAAVLQDGTYVAYARQTGTAGTATTNAHLFTILTQPPTALITLAPPGSSGTGSASFSFTSPAVRASFQCQLDAGGWSACTSPKQYSGLANGSHIFQVRAIDLAGNTGPAASDSWSVNTNLPALSLSSPADATASNDPTLAITGNGGIANGDANFVTVKIYTGTDIRDTPLQTLTTPVASGSGSWSTHAYPPLQDGTYTVFAQQTGSAGTAYSIAHTFTIDTVPPTTAITSGPQGTTSATSAAFRFTASERGATFECQLDGGAWTACVSPQSYNSLALGAHSFSVRAIDPAGNVDPNPPVATWTIDTSANVPLTLTAPADGTVTNDPTPSFSGAASAADGDISVEIDDSGGAPVETLTATAASAWSVTASPPLPDGTYTAFASQLGSDGVTTDYSSVVSFTIDTAPPAVTLAPPPARTTNDTTPTFRGQAGAASGDAADVALDIYSGTSASGVALQTIAATAADGGWQATASTLPDGTYTARAHQSDSAGNTGYSITRTLTIDTTAPNTSITGGPLAPTTSTAATFTFTSSKPGSSFQCRLDAAAWTACASPRAYAGLNVGSHSFAVRAMDPAGNLDPTPAIRNWSVVATGGPGSKVQITLRAKRRQQLGRRGRLHVRALCARACSVLMSGRLTIAPRAGTGIRAKRRTLILGHLLATKLAGGRQTTLTIRLKARTRRQVAAALAKKRRVTLVLHGVASARGMTPGTARITVRLLR